LRFSLSHASVRFTPQKDTCMEGCAECRRLLNLCLDASQALMVAQSELARHRSGADSEAFQILWNECGKTMNAVQALRADALSHPSSPGIDRPKLTPA